MYPLTLQMQQCIKIFAHFASNEQSPNNMIKEFQVCSGVLQRHLLLYHCFMVYLTCDYVEQDNQNLRPLSNQTKQSRNEYKIKVIA